MNEQDRNALATCEVADPPAAAGCGTCAQPAAVRLIIPPELARQTGSDGALTEDRCCLCWDELRAQLIAEGHTITDTTGGVAQIRAEFPRVNVFRSDEGVLYACVNGATYHAGLASQLRTRLEQVTVHAATTQGVGNELARR